MKPDTRHNLFICFAIAMLLSACVTSNPASDTLTFAPIKVKPARTGEILVFVGGGSVTNKGEHWFPEGSTLATVLDWAGLDPIAPPHTIRIVDTEGHAVRCRVAGRPRKELEQIRIAHGSRIIVPYDRCFALGVHHAAANRRPVGQSDGSGNLSVPLCGIAADPALRDGGR